MHLVFVINDFPLLWQVETTDDYDEYCHYVAGLVGLGLSKLFHASGSEDLAADSLSNSMGLFLQVFAFELCTTCPLSNNYFVEWPLYQCRVSYKLQKTNIIRDYLEDINEIPKSRMFWPRQIWSKYVNKLEVNPCEHFFLLKHVGQKIKVLGSGSMPCQAKNHINTPHTHPVARGDF